MGMLLIERSVAQVGSALLFAVAMVAIETDGCPILMAGSAVLAISATGIRIEIAIAKYIEGNKNR